MQIQELLTEVKKYDTTLLLRVLEGINNTSTGKWTTPVVIEKLTAAEVDSMPTIHITLLYQMYYSGGRSMYLYNSNSPFVTATEKINRNYYLMDNLKDLPKEDLIYLSKYHKSKWKQANPSGRATKKGTELKLSMDAFSLAVFKKQITKGFLRTEAKNYVLTVNKSFNDVAKTPETIKIRNKFYATILDNTEVHTNAMLNCLISTTILSVNGDYYNVSEGEAVVIEVGWGNTDLMSFPTRDAMDTYSSDVTLVTHNNGAPHNSCGVPESRVISRLASASSILLTAYAETSNEHYKTLAERMLQNIDIKDKNKLLTKTIAVQALRTILTK